MERVDEVAFERQRLAFELGCDQLRAERRPDQPARTEREQTIDIFGYLPRERQPVRSDGAERHSAAVISFLYFFQKNLPEPLDISLVARNTRRGVIVFDVEARAHDAQAVDR